MSLSTLSEVSYTSGIRQTSADREGQESLIQERSYSVMIADLEGIKRDLLILKKKVEENSNLLSANIRKQEEHTVGAEDIDYKTRYEHYFVVDITQKRKGDRRIRRKMPVLLKSSIVLGTRE